MISFSGGATGGAGKILSLPPNPKSRQKLSKKNGIRFIGYTFRLKNSVNPPPHFFRIFQSWRVACCERVAEWLRRLTRKPKVRTAVGSNPTLDSSVAVCNTSPGRPEPCEGNLVAVAGSCGGVMVKHPWPLLEISLSDFRGLATLNINTYLPTWRR